MLNRFHRGCGEGNTYALKDQTGSASERPVLRILQVLFDHESSDDVVVEYHQRPA